MIALRGGQIRATVSLTVAAAFLSACQSATNSEVLPSADGLATSLTHKQTFSYTGTPQQFTVPKNVTMLTVDALGAKGAAIGGLGARALATIPVTPGETLAVYVGGQGNAGNGGYNGGGSGGAGTSGSGGFGGGGASDVREGGDKLTDRVLIAAGGGGMGGGGSSTSGGAGGKGGARFGGLGQGGGGTTGAGGGGGGGTQHRGGHGGAGGNAGYYYGYPAHSGSRGLGGNGGSSAGVGGAGGGGGGGGGYYGAGGGGGGGSDSFVGASGGGGGGGSSFIESRAVSHREWRGWKNATGNGVIAVSW
jgi:hypothetical protein